MRQKSSFIRHIRFLGIVFLLGIGLGIITVNVASSLRDFNSRARKMRTDHNARQKQIIKQEVLRVVDSINRQRIQSEVLTKRKITGRIQEAYSITGNIYRGNKTTATIAEIKHRIREALRPIRYDQGNGYYTIIRLDGTVVLNPVTPELEGKNLLKTGNAQSRKIFREIIQISRKSGQGFYHYQWAKPQSPGNSFKKISFFKQFKPLGWIIMTGLYVVDSERQIKADLLSAISRIRFGKEGYIFINKFNGDALISNGELFSGTKKLWEIFSDNPEKMKEIFRKEYAAAQKPGGDFIYYTFIKLTSPEKESPKASFIYGIPDLKWIVGAGVYLDDVEREIITLHRELIDQIKARILYFILIAMGIIGFFLILFSRLSRKLRDDFTLFLSSFNRAANSDEAIDRDLFQFDEMDRMAENANKMLAEKILASRSLMDERERLFVTIRSIGDGVIATDMSGGVELMNKVAEKLTGWDSHEAEGKPLNEIFNIVDAKTRKPLNNPVERVLKTRKMTSLDTDTTLISREGSEFLIADSAAPIKDSDGNTIGVVLVFRDVTEEYRMREDLRRSEANLHSIFEAAKKVAFVKTDLVNNGGIIEFSAGAERIFGFHRGEAIGLPTSILYAKEEKEKLPKILKRISENRMEVSGETTLVKKSGDPFPALFTTYPVFGDNREISATIDVFIDISQRKQAEEALRKMERLKSVGTLAGGIAHDFNNILMGLYGNISLVKDELSENHPGIKPLDDAMDSMNRAIRLSKQLLTFAKGGEPVKESVNLGSIVEEVVRFDLSGSNTKPVFKLERDLWPAEVDKGQIQQVFSNLTMNAKQAMPDGGHLYIAMENAVVSENQIQGVDPGKYIRVTVTDEGPGIDEKILDRIFDPYFSTKDSGEGLGLATVYSIISKHGGCIHPEPGAAAGATFILYLPASKSRKPAGSGNASSLRLAGEQTARVLVMDDEEMIRRLVTKMLEKSGFFVQTARDGHQAIEMYGKAQKENEPFDAVILDLTIPGGMGGKEAIIKILDLDPEARVIVSSGYANDPVMSDYSKYGFQGIVAKPYTKSRLLEVLGRILGIATTPDKKPLQ